MIASPSELFHGDGVGDGLRGEVIVQVEVGLLHQCACCDRGLGERLQLFVRVEIVVAILRGVVRPPLRGVPAVQPHVVEARHVRQPVLADRKSELGLVDLRPRRAKGVQQRERLGDVRRSSCCVAAPRRPDSP